MEALKITCGEVLRKLGFIIGEANKIGHVELRAKLKDLLEGVAGTRALVVLIKRELERSSELTGDKDIKLLLDLYPNLSELNAVVGHISEFLSGLSPLVGKAAYSSDFYYSADISATLIPSSIDEDITKLHTRLKNLITEITIPFREYQGDKQKTVQEINVEMGTLNLSFPTEISEQKVVWNKQQNKLLINQVNTALRLLTRPKIEKANWNAQFQGLVELLEVTEQQKAAKYAQLRTLSKEFLHVAVTFGCTIISEAFLPPGQRTIAPVSLGGRAGGAKYIHHGIMFKFASDWMQLYGSDAYAMKAGGHELKSLLCYFGKDGIHVPLMALIDFRGFRLVAMSYLPISKETLVYGSDDGGKHVHASNLDFNEKMRDIGEQLHLKGHMAGLIKENRKYLTTPMDIEGHIGTDGLYYVVDFARTFPPTAGERISSEFLYKLFRPEFLQHYPIPLSSDAFSIFGGSDNSVHNQDVIEATNYLIQYVIPRFARWLDHYFQCLTDNSFEQLIELLHREGINIRYLGLVRSNLHNVELKQFLLVEMVSRAIKCMIRQQLRDEMKQQRTLEEECYIEVIVNFFNIILGNDSVKSAHFWDNQLLPHLHKQFERAIENETLDFSHCRNQIDQLFTRVQTLSGITLTTEAFARLKHNFREFNFEITDIETLGVRVKYMNVVSLTDRNTFAFELKELFNFRDTGLQEVISEVLVQQAQFSKFHYWKTLLKNGRVDGGYVAITDKLRALCSKQGISYNTKEKKERRAITKDKKKLKANTDEISQSIAGNAEGMLRDKISIAVRDRLDQMEKAHKTGSTIPEDEIPLYAIEEFRRLGGGAFGEVYSGIFCGSPIAVKLIRLQSLSHCATNEIENEVNIAKKLRSNYVVSFVGYCNHPSRLFLAMELMPGGDLYHLLHVQKEKLPLSKRLQMAWEIAMGLQDLHNSKVLHCDLKTQNILLDLEYHCKLADFGLGIAKRESSTLSTTGIGVGTITHMAPELLRTPAHFTPKSDVYAFGVVLFEIVAEQEPYKYVVHGVLPHLILSGMREIIPEFVSGPHRILINDCWRHDPAARPTIDNVIQRLESFQHHVEQNMEILAARAME